MNLLLSTLFCYCKHDGVCFHLYAAHNAVLYETFLQAVNVSLVSQAELVEEGLVVSFFEASRLQQLVVQVVSAVE